MSVVNISGYPCSQNPPMCMAPYLTFETHVHRPVENIYVLIYAPTSMFRVLLIQQITGNRVGVVQGGAQHDVVHHLSRPFGNPMVQISSLPCT